MAGVITSSRNGIVVNLLTSRYTITYSSCQKKSLVIVISSSTFFLLHSTEYSLIFFKVRLPVASIWSVANAVQLQLFVCTAFFSVLLPDCNELAQTSSSKQWESPFTTRSTMSFNHWTAIKSFSWIKSVALRSYTFWYFEFVRISEIRVQSLIPILTYPIRANDTSPNCSLRVVQLRLLLLRHAAMACLDELFT